MVYGTTKYFRNTAILTVCIICLFSFTREVYSFPYLISRRYIRSSCLHPRTSIVLFESFRQQQQSSSVGGSTTRVWPKQHQRSSNNGMEIPMLQPLSSDPLLYKSQTPILSKEECEILVTWVRSQICLDLNALRNGLDKGDEGAKILQKVQIILDAVLNNNNDTNEMNIVMPKYLSYTYENNNNKENHRRMDNQPHTLQEYGVDDLLPDGLHVDTNNGKYYRHWTVLLYLNSCQHLGATSFPLATTTSKIHKYPSLSGDDDDDHNDEVNIAAKFLIDENVQHTRKIHATQSQLMVGSILDRAAFDLFVNDKNNSPTKNPMLQQQQKKYGVRVMPEHGYFSLFSSLQKNGITNPKSFHGGEAMFVDESKEVLSFFYEISPNGITSLNDLGKKVEERENKFLNMHGSIRQQPGKTT